MYHLYICVWLLQVEEELVKRLGDAITLWTASLTSYSHESAGTLVIDDSSARGDRPRLEVSCLLHKKAYVVTVLTYRLFPIASTVGVEDYQPSDVPKSTSGNGSFQAH